MIHSKDVMELVERESQRSLDRWHSRELPLTCLLRGHNLEKLAILMEEVGEAAEAVKILCGLKPRSANLTEPEIARLLRDELVQVASITLSWLEAPDLNDLP
jgi:NTP pyrophosphatase (non-canonical NTP hydrolase)